MYTVYIRDMRACWPIHQSHSRKIPGFHLNLIDIRHYLLNSWSSHRILVKLIREHLGYGFQSALMLTRKLHRDKQVVSLVTQEFLKIHRNRFHVLNRYRQKELSLNMSPKLGLLTRTFRAYCPFSHEIPIERKLYHWNLSKVGRAIWISRNNST